MVLLLMAIFCGLLQPHLKRTCQFCRTLHDVQLCTGNFAHDSVWREREARGLGELFRVDLSALTFFSGRAHQMLLSWRRLCHAILVK